MIVLPDFDLPTRSASGFLIRHIVPRTLPPQLYGPLASKRLFSTLSFGDIIVGTGHGDEEAFTGQKEVVLLKVGEYDPKDIRGKVIKLLSCQCGLALGPDLVRKGATAFMGYRDDYVWVMDADYLFMPWADPVAALSLMPVVNCINAILDGRRVREAFDLELAGYSENAEEEEDELIASCLEFNRDNAVLIGDPNATIRRRPQIRFPIPPPPLLPISLPALLRA